MAWEQPQAATGTPVVQKGLIFVGIPHTGLVSTRWAENFHSSLLPYANRIHINMATSAPLDIAREVLAQGAVNVGAEYLYFLDTDIYTRPDTLQRLLNQDKPIVSALYYRRHDPQISPEDIIKQVPPAEAEAIKKKREVGVPIFHPAMWKDLYRENDKALVGFTPIFDGQFRLGDVLDIQGVIPMGCVLIKTEALRKIPQPRFFWGSQRPNAQPQISEDFFFSLQARNQGFKIIVDTGTVAYHEANVLIGPSGAITVQ